MTRKSVFFERQFPLDFQLELARFNASSAGKDVAIRSLRSKNYSGLFIICRATNILLVLLAALLAMAFVFELLRRQYRSAGTREQLFFLDRDFVALLLRH